MHRAAKGRKLTSAATRKGNSEQRTERCDQTFTCRLYALIVTMCVHTQIHASNERTHPVNTDIQSPVGEIQASYQVLRKNSSPCRTSLVTYFGVAGVSLPLLIFPTTHHSLPRGFANTPVPSGRQAPDWHLPGSGVLPRNFGWLWGPALSRSEAPTPTLLVAQLPLLCPAALAPLAPTLRETKQLNKNF